MENKDSPKSNFYLKLKSLNKRKLSQITEVKTNTHVSKGFLPLISNKSNQKNSTAQIDS